MLVCVLVNDKYSDDAPSDSVKEQVVFERAN